MNNCEIYFTSIQYKQQNWINNVDIFLDQVYNNLNEISGFNFTSISLNMAQVYNVSLKQTNYDSMTMFLKDVKFNGKEFLDLTSLSKLKNSIREQLSYIEGLYFGNMEIRCSAKYTDRDLGLYVPLKTVSKPQIIEQIKTCL